MYQLSYLRGHHLVQTQPVPAAAMLTIRLQGFQSSEPGFGIDRWRPCNLSAHVCITFQRLLDRAMLDNAILFLAPYLLRVCSSWVRRRAICCPPSYLFEDMELQGRQAFTNKMKKQKEFFGFRSSECCELRPKPHRSPQHPWKGTCLLMTVMFPHRPLNHWGLLLRHSEFLAGASCHHNLNIQT